MTSLPAAAAAAAASAGSSSRQPQRYVRARSSTTVEDTSTTATRRDLQDLDPEIRTRLQTIGMRSRKAVADGYLTKALDRGDGLARTRSDPTTTGSTNEKLVLCPEHWTGLRSGSGSGSGLGSMALEPFAETGHGLQSEYERRTTMTRKRPTRAALDEAFEEDGTIPTDPESEGDDEDEQVSRLPRVFAQPRRGLLAKTTSMPEAALRRHALGSGHGKQQQRPRPVSPTTGNAAMDETPEPWQRIQLDGYFDAQSGF